MLDQKTPTRRGFLKSASVGAFSMTLLPEIGLADIPSHQGHIVDPARRLNIACVGCGNKGQNDITGVGTENIVALCDVDSRQGQQIFARYPNVPKYKDFRQMLLEMDDKIDAVTVSTPDHMHYAAGIMAINMGKHVFIQKPLTRSVWEARDLMFAARKHNVMTQMGNQGHAGEGVRLAREWVQAGLIGDVREVHIWTRKLEVGDVKTGRHTRPDPGETIPEVLDWNLWVGSSPMRPYSAEYVPRKWRNWFDFGGGALGDIGCHTMDAAFYALDLTAPLTIQAETSPVYDETFPDWSVITYEFPAWGTRPSVKMVWYDGGKLPRAPRELGSEPLEPKCGYLMYGEKGIIYDPTEKCSSPRLLPDAKVREARLVPKTLPRIPNDDVFQEWIRACKGGPKAGSNFDYAAPLTEVVQLGNVAIRAGGAKIQWDPARMRIANRPDLDQYLRYPRRDY